MCACVIGSSVDPPGVAGRPASARVAGPAGTHVRLQLPKSAQVPRETTHAHQTTLHQHTIHPESALARALDCWRAYVGVAANFASVAEVMDLLLKWITVRSAMKCPLTHRQTPVWHVYVVCLCRLFETNTRITSATLELTKLLFHRMEDNVHTQTGGGSIAGILARSCLVCVCESGIRDDGRRGVDDHPAYRRASRTQPGTVQRSVSTHTHTHDTREASCLNVCVCVEQRGFASCCIGCFGCTRPPRPCSCCCSGSSLQTHGAEKGSLLPTSPTHVALPGVSSVRSVADTLDEVAVAVEQHGPDVFPNLHRDVPRLTGGVGRPSIHPSIYSSRHTPFLIGLCVSTNQQT